MRVLTLRATDGESTPPAMTEEEKAAGMVWRFVGATTPVNQKPNEAQVGIYHTWELSQGPSQKPTAMVEEPSFMDTVGLGRMERHRERHRAQQEQIRAWFLNPEAPVADRIHVMKGFLPHELLILARRIEIDGVVVKDRGGSPIPAVKAPVGEGEHDYCEPGCGHAATPVCPLETRRDTLIVRLLAAGFVEAQSPSLHLRKFVCYAYTALIPDGHPCEAEEDFRDALDCAEKALAAWIHEMATRQTAVVDRLLALGFTEAPSNTATVRRFDRRYDSCVVPTDAYNAEYVERAMQSVEHACDKMEATRAWWEYNGVRWHLYTGPDVRVAYIAPSCGQFTAWTMGAGVHHIANGTLENCSTAVCKHFGIVPPLPLPPLADEAEAAKRAAPVQGAFPTPIPGDTCATCDGNSSACPLCNPTEPPEDGRHLE